MMKSKTKQMILAVFALHLACGSSFAAVITLLTDNFNTTTTSNLDQDLLTRQGGILATTGYGSFNFPAIYGAGVFFPSPPIFDDTGVLALTNQKAWVNYDFAQRASLPDGLMTVSFDTVLRYSGTPDGNWLGINFGVLTPPGDVFDSGTDFGVLLTDQGNYNPWVHGSVVEALASFDASPTNREVYHVELRLYTSIFTLGLPATAELWINGIQLDLDSGTGGVNGRGFTWDAQNANYISFTGLSGQYIDNLQITEGIPEPSSLALLGLGAVIMLRRKQRS